VEKNIFLHKKTNFHTATSTMKKAKRKYAKHRNISINLDLCSDERLTIQKQHLATHTFAHLEYFNSQHQTV